MTGEPFYPRSVSGLTAAGPAPAVEVGTGTDRPAAVRAGDRLLDWALRQKPVTYGAVVLVICLVKYGIGLSPSWYYLQSLAQNWTHPTTSLLLQPPDSFRLSSSTSAVLAGMLHLKSGPLFLGFHFLLACAAIVTPFCLHRVRRSPELRLGVALLLVGGAVPAVLLGWVGSYDPVTLAAAAVAGLTQSFLVLELAWAVFAYNNAPEAAIALVVYALVVLAQNRKAALKTILLSGLGAVAGYAGIRVVTAIWGGGTSRLTVFQGYPFSRFVDSTLDYWPLIILSALGVGWLFLAHRDVFRLPGAKMLLLCAGVVSLGVPFIALDPTRIASGVLYPGLLFVTARAFAVPAATARRLLRYLAPFALLAVIVVVWSDSLVYPGWRNLGLFFTYIFGHAPIPLPTS